MYTEEQKKIIDADESLITVHAYAGTGKTFVLEGFINNRPENTFLYLAYNKSMADEASNKFKKFKNVKVFTPHALAYKKFDHQFKDRFGDLRAKDFCQFVNDEDEHQILFRAQKLNEYFKKWLNSAFTLDEFIKKICTKENMFYLRRLSVVWNSVLALPGFPVEHDIYLKLYQLSKPVLKYDYILVDEAQDTSDVMVDIVMRQKKANKIFIGDEYQQIYAWRGAVNSLSKLKNDSAAYTLSQSFRCPQRIAQLADNYLCSLLKAETAYKGNDVQGAIYVGRPSRGRFTYICRTNARLFQYAVSKRKSKTFSFVGGIGGYGFGDIIDIQHLENRDNYEFENKFIESFSTLEELQAYAHKANELDFLTKIKIAKRYPNAANLLLDFVIDDENPDVVLTTGHKAKGLEWDNVVLAGDFWNFQRDFKWKWKSIGGEIPVLQDELNLLYVSMTRAQQEIYIPKSYILTKDDIKLAKKYAVLVDAEEYEKRMENI